ncbi:MAG TPA: phosphate ABC transporter permease subunit PstC, partial [Pseudogracilibacillus sp.]|nr:phosphate ABC transporter permease subunit PstC [Pseudogracilibacillus sp.]
MSPNSKVTRLDVRKMIINKSKTRKVSEKIEKLIPILLFVIASTSILITIGIVFTLLSETIEFFKRIPIWDFFTGT